MKKIALRTETLRELTGPEAAQVGGGSVQDCLQSENDCAPASRLQVCNDSGRPPFICPTQPR